jgi:TfoX/Sxy family transcriptional regulator of competence genes
MATDKEFITYLLDTLRPVGSLSVKGMFGEYALYLDEKVLGFVCDNQLFLKITDAGRTVLGDEVVEAPAYPGSKPYFLIESFEDADFMTRLIHRSWQELPFKKTKSPTIKKK